MISLTDLKNNSKAHAVAIRYLFFALILALIAPNASALTGGYDYYRNNAPPGLLKHVEQYHLKPGEKKLARGAFAYAMADAKFMLHYFPNDPNALKLAMEIALQWPNHANAAEHLFNDAVKSYPQYAQTYLIHAVYLHRRGKLEEAVKQYRKALDRNPNSADAHYNLGLALVRLNRLKEANQEAHKAYALGHPLPGLKKELMAKGAWDPPNSKGQ